MNSYKSKKKSYYSKGYKHKHYNFFLKVKNSEIKITTTTPTITYLTEKQTATNVGDSATIGANLIPPAVGVNAVFSDIGPFDYRTEVTQVGERTVNIQKTVTPVEAETTTIEAELKAPTVISISLHLSF